MQSSMRAGRAVLLVSGLLWLAGCDDITGINPHSLAGEGGVAAEGGLLLLEGGSPVVLDAGANAGND